MNQGQIDGGPPIPNFGPDLVGILRGCLPPAVHQPSIIWDTDWCRAPQSMHITLIRAIGECRVSEFSSLSQREARGSVQGHNSW